MVKVLGTLREDANVPKRGTSLFHYISDLVLDNPASWQFMFIQIAFHSVGSLFYSK